MGPHLSSSPSSHPRWDQSHGCRECEHLSYQWEHSGARGASGASSPTLSVTSGEGGAGRGGQWWDRNCGGVGMCSCSISWSFSKGLNTATFHGPGVTSWQSLVTFPQPRWPLITERKTSIGSTPETNPTDAVSPKTTPYWVSVSKSGASLLESTLVQRFTFSLIIGELWWGRRFKEAPEPEAQVLLV